MASFFITGASRGIGLELVKQLLESPPSQVGKVIASSRSASAPLQSLIASNPDRAHHVIAATDDADSIQKAVQEVQSILSAGGLDVLVNNAGATANSEGGVTGLSPEVLTEILNVNVVGVQRITTAFMPLLEKGNLKKVINMSTTTGSISWAPKFAQQPAYAYKISKAALNMLSTQYALEYGQKGFTFLLISPGWLKTDLGGGEMADLTVDVGVKELKRIILDSTAKDNGKFLNIHVPGWEEAYGQYDGKEISW